jgi:hypothetical protein
MAGSSPAMTATSARFHIQSSNSNLQTCFIALVLCPAWGCRSSVAFPSPREGVRNAWAFHRTRGPVCKRGRKDAHELLTNAAPRLRSARAGLTACRIPAEPSPAHLTKYGGPHRIAGPLGPSALGAVVIPFPRRASSPRHEQGPAPRRTRRIPLRDRKTVRTRPHIGAERRKNNPKFISEKEKFRRLSITCSKIG